MLSKIDSNDIDLNIKFWLTSFPIFPPLDQKRIQKFHQPKYRDVKMKSGHKIMRESVLEVIK